MTAMNRISRTFIVYVEDKPGVLNRVISLVRRRNYNIDSLTVGRTERPHVSRITLVMNADPDEARRMEANLYKLVNVLYVTDVTHQSAVIRELALVKVKTDEKNRSEVLQLCDVFRARVVNVTNTAVTLEATGDSEKVDGLLNVLRPFGILEMVRTGAVAMSREGEAEVDKLLEEAGVSRDPSPKKGGPIAA
jgi:acetolactate synthase-1/3 small subunit